MVLVIRKVENGFIVKFNDGEDILTEVVEVKETYTQGNEDEVEAFMSLLWKVNNLIGPQTSKHSAKRITIGLEPGEDYG